MQGRLNEVFTTVQPMPGVVKLVHHLEKHGIPMAVRFLLGRSLSQSITSTHITQYRLLPALNQTTTRSRPPTSISFLSRSGPA